MYNLSYFLYLFLRNFSYSEKHYTLKLIIMATLQWRWKQFNIGCAIHKVIPNCWVRKIQVFPAHVIYGLTPSTVSSFSLYSRINEIGIKNGMFSGNFMKICNNWISYKNLLYELSCLTEYIIRVLSLKFLTVEWQNFDT